MPFKYENCASTQFEKYSFIGSKDNQFYFFLKDKEDKEEELKPCPFCGAIPSIHETKHFGIKYKYYFIECMNPDCFVGCMTDDFTDKEELIKAWNTRY